MLFLLWFLFVTFFLDELLFVTLMSYGMHMHYAAELLVMLPSKVRCIFQRNGTSLTRTLLCFSVCDL